MKVYSGNQLPTYQVSGRELRIHWDAKEVPMFSMDGEPITQWEQNEALCLASDSYGVLVGKIIRSVYSVDAEFATINNKDTKSDEYAAYQAFRQTAKDLAKAWSNK